MFLGPPVAALTFLAVVEDPARRPVTAWLAAGTGAVVSIAWAGFTGTTASVIPFVTVIIGAITGHLVRSVEHSQALKSETSHLHAQTRRGEEQTRWLEQRTSLARELHDVVGHHVTAMVVQAEAGLVARPAEALHSIGITGAGRWVSWTPSSFTCATPMRSWPSQLRPASPTSRRSSRNRCARRESTLRCCSTRAPSSTRSGSSPSTG